MPVLARILILATASAYVYHMTHDHRKS
ncbi:hypothetical protein MICRO80W_270058 [Micrococcus luteus]|nr:hypothetical protein MICRO80W_270058 [Micrococcus luteus]